MNESFILDRIEGKKFILEKSNGEIIEVNKEFIFDNVKEGDVLFKRGVKYYLDKKLTKKRRDSISNLMEGMWAD